MKYKIDWYVIFFLFAILLFKPTMLGAILTPIGMVIMLLMIIVKHNRNIDKKVFHIIIATFICFGYYYFLDIIKVGKSNSYHLKAMLSIIVLLLGYGLAFTNLHKEILKKYFILLLACFSLSCCATCIMSIFYSDIFSLKIIEYSIPIYEYEFIIYSPFTPATGTIPLGGIQIARLSALFRECGIAQLFYCWALAESHYYFEGRYRIYIQILLFFGVFFCLSTTGLISIFLYFFLRFFYNLKKQKTLTLIIVIPVFIAIIIGLYWLVMYAPIIGLENKNEISANSRIGDMDGILTAWTANFSTFLFGVPDDNFRGTTYTAFYQRSYYIGAIGLALYFIIILIGYLKSENRQRFLLANIGGIVTMLMAQPIWEAPILVLLWAMPYSKTSYIEDVGIDKS